VAALAPLLVAALARSSARTAMPPTIWPPVAWTTVPYSVWEQQVPKHGRKRQRSEWSCPYIRPNFKCRQPSYASMYRNLPEIERSHLLIPRGVHLLVYGSSIAMQLVLSLLCSNPPPVLVRRLDGASMCASPTPLARSIIGADVARATPPCESMAAYTSTLVESFTALFRNGARVTLVQNAVALQHAENSTEEVARLARELSDAIMPTHVVLMQPNSPCFFQWKAHERAHMPCTGRWQDQELPTVRAYPCERLGRVRAAFLQSTAQPVVLFAKDWQQLFPYTCEIVGVERFDLRSSVVQHWCNAPAPNQPECAYALGYHQCQPGTPEMALASLLERLRRASHPGVQWPPVTMKEAMREAPLEELRAKGRLMRRLFPLMSPLTFGFTTGPPPLVVAPLPKDPNPHPEPGRPSLAQAMRFVAERGGGAAQWGRLRSLSEELNETRTKGGIEHDVARRRTAAEHSAARRQRRWGDAVR